MRNSLEKCDVDADIDLFVREKATGSQHPSPVLYINFYHPADSLGQYILDTITKHASRVSIYTVLHPTSTKNETMAPLHVATLEVKRELPKYDEHLGSLPYLCAKNETMAPLHVDTLTVKRELPKYEIILSI